VSTLPPFLPWARASRRAALALAAMLPAACAMAPPPPPLNPFFGAWSTTERSQIAFRDDTLVINPPGSPPTAMSPQSCPKGFQFQYGRKSREALLALAGNQPEVGGRLSALLVQPEYPVAELRCDQGDNTYVLLNDRDLIAIYRDQGIAGFEQLSRSGASS
jgi:hypothetical protein